MAWRLAESLKTLRAQINAAYPNRDKSSDGSVGDLSHRSRASDHNPNAAGVVTAIDIDEDLAPDIHSIEQIVSSIRASRDPRVKYIIYERRITVAGSDLQKWKPYTGVNPHNHHAHISVNSDPKLYDSTKPWSLPTSSTATQPNASPSTATDAQNAEIKQDPVTPTSESSLTRVLRLGDKGEDVRKIQTTLGISADGAFGKNTRQAVIVFQRSHGLDADGIVGEKTWRALGL